MHNEQQCLFIADVLALKLSFPIVAIAERTNEDRANVSRYVRGRAKPSKSFLRRFYTVFKKDLAAIGIRREMGNSPGDNPPPPDASESDHLWEMLKLVRQQLVLTQEFLETLVRVEQTTNELLKRSNYRPATGADLTPRP